MISLDTTISPPPSYLKIVNIHISNSYADQPSHGPCVEGLLGKKGRMYLILETFFAYFQSR